MRLSRKLVQGIQHPGRAIRYIFGGNRGKQDAIYSFITDYDRDKGPLRELGSFLKTDLTQYHNELLLNPLYLELENEIAEKSVDESRRDLWLFGFTESRLLYVLCRALTPEVVIETGVASGLSSFMFLLALKQNSKGHLYSIDLPFENTRFYPPGKTVGWIVPSSLKDRWTLNLGDSKNILPKILNETNSCDLFLHDSLHTEEHMNWEYETVWPHLRGALLSDDIYLNNAFDTFTKKNKCSTLKISKRLGIAIPK